MNPRRDSIISRMEKYFPYVHGNIPPKKTPSRSNVAKSLRENVLMEKRNPCYEKILFSPYIVENHKSYHKKYYSYLILTCKFRKSFGKKKYVHVFIFVIFFLII